MKPYLYLRSILIIIFLGFICSLPADSKNGKVQDEPVLAPNTSSAPPTVDGVGDDACWQNLAWQSIDQVWIPYDGSVTTDDYTGHYKIVWSSVTNLLYLLIEVSDDVFIDGYIPNQTAGLYNFDISEVFIDADTSGGLHMFDATGSDTVQYGSNAENAFSYHIYAAFPADGQVDTVHRVEDMDGTRWGNNWQVDNTAHLPEFALYKNGNIAVWEFSLKVYNDTYESNNQEPARVQLQTDKILGMSVAYCDNDNDDQERDNMFGSVWEAAPGNLHWMNADGYGRIKLVESIPDYIPGGSSKVSPGSIKLYPNPASSSMQIQIINPYQGQVSIRVFNLLGQEVLRTSGAKSDQSFNKTLALNHLSAGIYFVQTQMGQLLYRDKLVITPHK